MKKTRSLSHLQQVLDVSLLGRALDAEQRPSVHLAGLTRLPERNTTCNVVEICDFIAGMLWIIQTHGLTWETKTGANLCPHILTGRSGWHCRKIISPLSDVSLLLLSRKLLSFLIAASEDFLLVYLYNP